MHSRGFTLIELSIVLVIIGLIVGGILVGRDLISAASVRAQISQIEKYQQAVNTFRGKYGFLPGDIPEPDVSRFGFAPRGPLQGQGDGNGIIQGGYSGGTGSFFPGEPILFWVDLSTSRLIGNSFVMTYDSGIFVPNTGIKAYLPEAVIGRNNSVSAFTGQGTYSGPPTGINYFGLSANFHSSTNAGAGINSQPGLTVAEASSIDGKIDDRLPLSGSVFAGYPYDWSHTSYYIVPIPASGNIMTNFEADNSTIATSGSTTTCFDNNNVGGDAQRYSVGQNNGAGMNCALSFKFQ